MTRKDGRPRSVPVTLPLDPKPWLTPWEDSERAVTDSWAHYRKFSPRPGYSQNREDYA